MAIRLGLTSPPSLHPPLSSPLVPHIHFKQSCANSQCRLGLQYVIVALENGQLSQLHSSHFYLNGNATHDNVQGDVVAATTTTRLSVCFQQQTLLLLDLLEGEESSSNQNHGWLLIFYLNR